MAYSRSPEGLFKLVSASGEITLGNAAKTLSVPKNMVWDWACELRSHKLVGIKTHLLRDFVLTGKYKPAEKQAKVISISNQKGGVGKTTTAINLASCLAYHGKKTLLLDIDPQSNATSGLGFNKHNVKHSTYHALIGEKTLSELITPTRINNLDAVPANVDLAGAEVELVPLSSRENKLRYALYGIKNNYDFIILDCPPALGMITVNALAATDSVLIPVQCDYYALEGIGQLLGVIELVRKRLNSGLRLEGILLTMYEPRVKLSTEIAGEVKNYFGGRVYSTTIPRSVKLSEAASCGKTIMEYDPNSSAAKAYMRLAYEVVKNV